MDEAVDVVLGYGVRYPLCTLNMDIFKVKVSEIVSDVLISTTHNAHTLLGNPSQSGCRRRRNAARFLQLKGCFVDQIPNQGCKLHSTSL